MVSTIARFKDQRMRNWIVNSLLVRLRSLNTVQ